MRITIVYGVLLALTLVAASSFAADLNWRGQYKFEGVSLRGAPLDGTQTKEYFMHHLILRPKIIAADGLNLYGRFDLLNNDYSDSLGHKGGEFFGARTSTAGTTSGQQDPEFMEINQLYLTWLQEHGSLIVGRMPLEFGLGLSLDAGEDQFDHYLDNVDGVGYKIVMGNLYFLPVYGKYGEGNLSQEDEIYQYYAQVQYENPDTELSLGLVYDVRVATSDGNDAPGGPYDPTAATTDPADGEWKTENIGLSLGQKYELGRLDVEAGFYRGSTGVQASNGNEISIDAFAVVAKFMTENDGSKWNWGLTAGYLTGDDPDTEDVYEGYVADRNFDVGLLLFNHPIGGNGVLGTSDFYINNRTSLAANNRQNLPDVDALSNALFLAPSLKWQFKEKWALKGTLLWAQLNQPQYGEADAGLGTEIDASVIYSPHKSLTWTLDAGLLLPGSAFEVYGDPASPSFNDDLEMAYLIQTRAAISF